MTDQRGRSSLTSMAHMMRDPDPAAITKIGAALWHQFGIVCVDPKKFKSFADEKQAEILAELAYGKREKGTQDGD
jgi:hypothetical protein